MITIVSGTNRIGNKSILLAQYYQQYLQNKGLETSLFNLEHLPDDFLLASRYADHRKSPAFLAIQEQYFFPAERYFFVLPEYNGSVPGILKLVLDSCDIEKAFYFKKACLTGLSSGRAGNLRGLDHLTNILHYLKMQVYHHKQPISRISSEMGPQGEILQESTRKTVADQIDGFLRF